MRYVTRCLFKWPDCLPALQLRAELYLGVQQNFTKAFLDYQAVLAKADCRGTTMTARRGLADALRGLGELKGSFFPPPDTPGEGPLTATKTSVVGGGQPGLSRIWGRVLSRHPLKFMEICKFNGFP